MRKNAFYYNYRKSCKEKCKTYLTFETVKLLPEI